MPRSQDVIFVVKTTEKTDCFTPCTCVQGNYVYWESGCRYHARGLLPELTDLSCIDNVKSALEGVCNAHIWI